MAWIGCVAAIVLGCLGLVTFGFVAFLLAIGQAFRPYPRKDGLSKEGRYSLRGLIGSLMLIIGGAIMPLASASTSLILVGAGAGLVLTNYARLIKKAKGN